MSGLIRSFTRAVTTVPKAAPITTPTARSTTLPRNINCLKPDNIAFPPPPTEAANLTVALPLVKGQGSSRLVPAHPFPAPNSLPCRRDVKNIFDQEAVRDVRFQRLPLLRSRFIQLIHRLQSPQDIHMRHALVLRIFSRLDMRPGKNCGNPIPPGGIAIPGIGNASHPGAVPILVDRENQQAVVFFRPLIISVKVLPQPFVSAIDRLVIHVVIEIRNHESDCRYL